MTNTSTTAQLGSCSADIEQWIDRNFSGHGRALRTLQEPPIDGEPFMSMEDAKQLLRDGIAKFSALQPATPTAGEWDGCSSHCVAGARDGVLCANETCDILSGVRELPATPVEAVRAPDQSSAGNATSDTKETPMVDFSKLRTMTPEEVEALPKEVPDPEYIKRNTILSAGIEPAAWSRIMTERSSPVTWEVEVRVNGDSHLTIGHNHLAGNPEVNEDIVEKCALHLLSFIGRQPVLDEAARAREPDAWQYRMNVGGWLPWHDIDMPMDYFLKKHQMHLDNGSCEMRPLYCDVAQGSFETQYRNGLEEIRRYAKKLRNSRDLTGPSEYANDAKALKVWQRALYHEGKTIEGMVKAALRGAQLHEPEKAATSPISSTDRAAPTQDEMENYRLALAWINGQSTDPQAKEIAETALDSFTVTRPHRGSGR